MWHFRNPIDGEIIRGSSREEEFFEAHTSLEAVVREAIQNSIDAVNDPTIPVTVRFALSRTRPKMEHLFEGLWEHLNASGILVDSPGRSGFRYMSIEDFNTTGLTGETSYRQCAFSNEGDFCNFWWVDSSSRKGLKKGGRWGVGKYSFFIFSKLKHFYGISVADHSGVPNLMGRALLKKHNIGEVVYLSDGVFSPDNLNPITDIALIDTFQSDFGLQRGTSQGLSLIIPYPDLGNSANPYSDILFCALNNYQYSVIAGKLILNVEENTNGERRSCVITRETLPNLLQNFSRAEERFKEFELLNGLYDSILLRIPDFNLDITRGDPMEIGEDSFSGHIEEARKRFSSLGNSVMKIRVALKIHYHNLDAKDSYADISITRDPRFGKSKEVQCLRNGIKINDAIRDFKMQEGIMLLVAEDGPISEFLGDAENPVHTEWNSRTEIMRSGKYDNAEELVKFIKKLPRKIIDVLTENPTSVEENALLDLFYTMDRGTSRSGRRSSPPPPPPPPRPRFLSVSKSGTGFKIGLTEEGARTLPRIITVRVAYDMERGNPFPHYKDFDFKIGESETPIDELRGGRVLEKNENKVIIIAESEDFIFSVSGFDSRRDIVIDAKSKEVANP